MVHVTDQRDSVNGQPADSVDQHHRYHHLHHLSTSTYTPSIVQGSLNLGYDAFGGKDEIYCHGVRFESPRRRRRHRVASSGRRVAPPWSRRMACLQRLAGTNPVSLRS